MDITIKDIFNLALNNEFRILIIEKILEKITDKNPDFITQEEVDKIKQECVEIMKEIYPDANIREIK